MPTSVLLAVLVAAGLLALAPALVRRYDAVERLEAERAQSTARVLSRTRRKRTIPGRRPINPPLRMLLTVRAAAPDDATSTGTDGAESADAPLGSTAPIAVATEGQTVDGHSDTPAGSYVALSGAADPDASAGTEGVSEAPSGRATSMSRSPSGQDRNGRRTGRGDRNRRSGRTLTIAPRSAPPARRQQPHTSPAVYRRRRVLAALLLLNLVKLVGVIAVGPGFWIGFAVTATLLVVYLGYLRHLAVLDQRHRRVEARKRARLAAQQAEVRREQERRAAARRAAARRMAEQRESLRRSADGWSADPTVSYRRASGDGS